MTTPSNSSTPRKTPVFWFLCFAISGQIMELTFADGEPSIPVHFVIPGDCLDGYVLTGPTGMKVLTLQSTGNAYAIGLSFNGTVLTGHVTHAGEYHFVRNDGTPSSDECSLTFHAVKDECVSDPCQNGATCHDGVETYTCACTGGWTGTNCQNDINECSSSPCQNGGICTNAQNMYTCLCEAGWTGTNCETDINECSSSPCQNGGICTNAQNMYTCLCEAGWSGTNCETDINECSSSPCQNGGICTNAQNMYTCLCEAGWSGTNCETDRNECDSSPCQNGGICRDGQNIYTCSCETGWTGTNCEADINDCDSSPCQNNASCIDGQNVYKCLCESGWSGTNCETDLKVLLLRKYGIPVGIAVGILCLLLSIGAVCIFQRRKSRAGKVHERPGADDHPNPIENAEYMEMEGNELYAEIEPIDPDHDYALMDDVIDRPQSSNEPNTYLTTGSEHCTPRVYGASNCQKETDPKSAGEHASSHIDTDAYVALQQRQSSIEDEYNTLGNIDIIDTGSYVRTSDERPESSCYLLPSNRSQGDVASCAYDDEDGYVKPEPRGTNRLGSWK